MMADEASDPSKPKPLWGGLLSALGLPPAALLLVFVLTLLVWVFFRQQNMPLDLYGTTVVLLAFAILLAGGRAIWNRLHRPPPPQ